MKKDADAAVAYRKTLRYDPGLAEACGQFAALLADSKDPTVHDQTEALRMARHACELSFDHDITLLQLLADIAAKSNEHGIALKAMHDAINQARIQRKFELAEALTGQLEKYETAATIFGLMQHPQLK
jgi:cytochrome c-type biogenesis protein CcmH/NrfG